MKKIKKESKLIIIVLAIIAIVLISIIIISLRTPKEENIVLQNGVATENIELKDVEFSEITSSYAGGITTIRAKMHNNSNTAKNLNIEIILKDENGNQNYSSYVELNFPFTVKGVDLNATCGVLPYDAGITTYGGDVNSGFAVTNVALKATKDIKITDSFSLPIFTQAIWNPRMEDAHLVLGISLRP